MKLFEALDRYNKVRHNNWKNGRYLTRNKWGNVVNERGEDWLVNFNIVDDNDWEEYKGPVLDEKEKEYLSAVIKPFRDRITYIAKVEEDIHWFYWIMIRVDIGFLNDYYDFCLPPFEETSDMYKNMEEGKEYTLEELGL